MKHILIRGDRGVGKSTLIARLLNCCDAPVYGFITKKINSEGGKAMVYIHPAMLAEEGRDYEPENLVAVITSGAGAEKHPEVFDAYGVRCLERASASGIILMDELGFLEADAHAFQEAVLRRLDGNILVIAAVKSQENDFLRKVCSHPLTEIYDITPENRDRLFEQLAPMFQ